MSFGILMRELLCGFKPFWDFPVSPVVKTSHLQCRRHGFGPGLGKILHAMWPEQKTRNIVNQLRVPPKLLQSGPTLCDPMDCGPPGSSVPGILQARILEWVPIPCSRGSSQRRDQTQFSLIAGGFFTVRATPQMVNGASNEKGLLKIHTFFCLFS